ncbi:MAG: molybdopterin dinucleotide binding domain-containing protein, partial [Pseudomonadota bacterium]
ARMLPLTCKSPAAKTGPRYPYRLNTGRIRDQWHTMTRTALSPRLSAHLAEPFVEIHPTDARSIGITAADLVRLKSPQGSAILRAVLSDSVTPGQIFAPIHWTGETAPSGRIDDLVAPITDPVSGQPESKASVVSAERFDAAWYGFAVSSGPLLPECSYWARSRTQHGWRAELAGLNEVDDWHHEARRLFGLPDAEVLIFEDKARGDVRLAFMQGDRLLAALFVARRPVAVMRDYLATLPGDGAPDVLTGRTPADRPDPGPTLCACFGVGVNTILTAIETGQLTTVEAVGQSLNAGTNCGSCRPEIAALLTRTMHREAAE